MQVAKKTTTKRQDPIQAAAKPVKDKPDQKNNGHHNIQFSRKISSPEDPAEKEAEHTAKKIMRMSAPSIAPSFVNQEDKPIARIPQIARLSRQAGEKFMARRSNPDEDRIKRQAEQKQEPDILRQEEKEDDKAPVLQSGEQETLLQRQVEGAPDVADNVSADIRGSMSTGEPLPLSVRRFMEPRFNADFSRVRIHTDTQAQRLNRQVNAKAFTVGNHIFFGRNQFQPENEDGKELIAHELTHTLQQEGSVQRQSDAPQVKQRTGSQLSRLGISDALDYFADRAYHIPGYRMFTVILGVNPINMQRVERSAANILRAVIEFMPGGHLISQALDRHGIVDRVASWVMQQINTLQLTGSVIRDALYEFLDSLSWRDIFRLGSVWERAKRIFTRPINAILNLVRGLVGGILRIIKEVILRPLAQMASRTRGWDLLTAVLGFNPITGDPVPRNAETLIGGFMKLIGQEEVWNNIKRANAVARAWAWFQGAISGLLGFVRSIPSLFLNALRALQIQDLLDIPRAFLRVGRVFAGFIGRFIRWAGSKVMRLLRIIFDVVAPGIMPYIRRAAGAFSTIIRNPVRFVRNLVRAATLGFRRFATNFVGHLRGSLINWLTGAMSGAGVYIPQAFTLREILKFILSVLGLTWQNIRVKLVRVIGETAVRAMESGFELIRTLITEGPAAAWRQIVEGIGNLRDMVMEQIISFVRSRIVTVAITRLLSMLSPAGAFIQAIIATYNTIMFFVERLRTIMQVAMSFLNSIAAIAIGRIVPAATRVENTLAGMLTLVISFLARIAGLGRVSDAISNIINRVRRPIDRGLDRIVAWIVQQARRLGRFIAQAGVPQDPRERIRLAARASIAAARRLQGRLSVRLLSPLLNAIRVRYGLRSIEPFIQNGTWWVRIINSPETLTDTGVASNQENNAEIPDRVQILDSNGRVMITNYSRSSRTGIFQNALFSGNVTLNKLKHDPQEGQQGEQTIDTETSADLNYTISAANNKGWDVTVSNFQAVDRKDPDESETYSRTREAFPAVMRNWWETESNDPRINQLHSIGLIDVNEEGLLRGASKWRYLYSILSEAEQNLLADKAVNKANMTELLSKLPVQRRDELKQRWKQRWAGSTQIHHIKPINFGGGNENFIPLKAAKHVGADGVHPKFWTPLKRFLMRLR